jgi:glyoxylase-like metal-dependent hydrolase (beta-lactamase superfamily II)
MQALAKNPDHRQQSILEIRDALRDIFAPMLQRRPHRRTPADLMLTTNLRAEQGTALRRVTLAQASQLLEREIVEIAPEVFWVGRREGVYLERNIYLRVYRGQGLQINVIIDPGPTKDLNTLAAKVKPIIGSLEKVDIIFINHQDPDVAGNAPVIQELNPQAHVFCSEDTWRLAQFYGLKAKGYSAIEHLKDLRLTLATGHQICFVPTPYCHFRGATMYYDMASRVLFTGDLFGGLSPQRGLVAKKESFSGIDIFHQLYMPSCRALQNAVARVRRLDPPPVAIAPQHGGIIAAEQIETVLCRVEKLKVGVDLFDIELDSQGYLQAVNAIVELLVQDLGPSRTTEELRCFSADGTFPNLFVFEGEHRIKEIKIHPQAAVQALIERSEAFLPPEKRPRFQAAVIQIFHQQGLSLAPIFDISPDASFYFDYHLE